MEPAPRKPAPQLVLAGHSRLVDHFTNCGMALLFHRVPLMATPYLLLFTVAFQSKLYRSMHNNALYMYNYT
jgi:hypothetical protein